MVTEQRIPSRAELLDALRSSGREVLARLRALPAEEFEHGRYENGWNGRQILAHVASIEWTYPRLLDVAKGAPPASADQPRSQIRRTDPGEAGSTPTQQARGGIDGYNERQVAKRANASIEELLAEFERNRQSTIVAVEGVEDALLVRPIRSAGGITGALADVIYAVAVQHVLGHAGDILGESLTDTRW